LGIHKAESAIAQPNAVGHRHVETARGDRWLIRGRKEETVQVGVAIFIPLKVKDRLINADASYELLLTQEG
jgi:hypothetical protein